MIILPRMTQNTWSMLAHHRCPLMEKSLWARGTLPGTTREVSNTVSFRIHAAMGSPCQVWFAHMLKIAVLNMVITGSQSISPCSGI